MKLLDYTKELSILAGCIVMLLALWYIFAQRDEAATQRAAAEAANKTIIAMQQQQAKTDKQLADTARQSEVIANELNSTRKQIKQLKRTQQQIDCSKTPVPDGYHEHIERLLHASD